MTTGPGPGLDIRLVPSATGLWVGCWLATGATTATARRAWLATGIVLTAAVVTWLVRARRDRHAVGDRHSRCGRARAPVLQVVLAAVAVGAGLILGLTRVVAADAGPLPRLAREQAVGQFEVVITGDARVLPARARGDVLLPPRRLVPARVEQVRARGESTSVRTPVTLVSGEPGWDTLLPGTRLELVGRARLGPDGSVSLQVGQPPDPVVAPPWWQQAASAMRSGLRDASGGPTEDGAALLPGLVVGDTSAMPAELEADMRATGLTHLTAVSGGNVAIVVGAVLWVARGVGARGGWLVVLAALTMAAFLVVTRAEPSVLRATVMAGVGLLAVAGGRARSALPALSAAVAVLLLADPTLSRSYGFALSALATGGLIVWARPWGEALARWLGRTRLPARVARPAGYALAVPVAAQVAVAPVLVLLDPALSLVSVPANLAAAPAVAPATVLGLVAAVIGLLAPTVAGAVGWVGGVPAAWIGWVGRAGADLPGGRLPWPSGAGGALALVAVFGVLALAARAVRARWPELSRQPGRRWYLLTVGVSGLAVAVALVAATRLTGSRGWPPTAWAVVACDVGQGDALVVRTGPGQGIVVDAGPDPDLVDACLRRLDVTLVPLLVLTHLHADHVEGVPGVLRGRRVDAVLAGPYGEPAAEAERVTGWLADAAVPLWLARPGQSRRVGDAALVVLGPQRVIAGEGSTPNNASVVVWVRTHGVTALLTGDVESAAQRMLLASPAVDAALPVDVLKVPHHGSANQDPELLAGSGARVGLISVGAGNDYGHPAVQTLRALQRAGVIVARTDLGGDIAVVGPSGHLTLVRR